VNEKKIYKPSELPDHTLEEFEDIAILFLEFMVELSEKYHYTAINAGMSKAMLQLILQSKPEHLKKNLLAQAEYFLLVAESLDDE
jgi:hypothetical protein